MTALLRRYISSAASNSRLLNYSEEVEHALHNSLPIVAFETTIVC